MRGITGTLVVLLAVGYVASRAGLPAVSSSGSAPNVQEVGWRRTAQGWEHNGRWTSPAAASASGPSRIAVHPASIAVLQLLVCLLVLRLDRSHHRTDCEVRPPCVDAAAPDNRCPEDA